MRVSVDLSGAEIAWIDRAVTSGLFESRDSAIRSAIDGALGYGWDDAAIAEAYRKGYEAHPADENLSQAGLDLLAEAIRPENRNA